MGENDLTYILGFYGFQTCNTYCSFVYLSMVIFIVKTTITIAKDG